MPERKVWSEEEDRILKLLREERAERKWANIARIMATEFGVEGRTGKQCRERYHNHLDSSIISSEWRVEQQHLLFQLHKQVGNKWSVISQRLPGRSDNCVKNHFYSKLRKAIRRLNKLIHDVFPTQHKFIRESVLSRIIKTTQSKFKNNTKIDEELAQFCDSIKNRLFRFELQQGSDQQDLDFANRIILDIQNFDRDYKKGYKGIRHEYQYQYKTYLKPPSKTTLLKKTSSLSCSSLKSEDSCSSFFSSSSCYSLSSLSDLSSFQAEIDNQSLRKKSSPPKSQGNGAKSLGTTSGRNSEAISKSQKIQQRLQDSDFEQKLELPNEHILKPSTFQMQHQDLIMDDSEFYDRNNNMRGIGEMSMNCEQSPRLGSILAPREVVFPFSLFGKDEQDNQQIEYRGEADKMDLQ